MVCFELVESLVVVMGSECEGGSVSVAPVTILVSAPDILTSLVLAIPGLVTVISVGSKISSPAVVAVRVEISPLR